jgi:two-component system nitrogen regulation response regulator GlnG
MLGALDYVAKPCDATTIRDALARARSTQAANQDHSGLIGHSTPIARLARQVRQFAPAPYPVLLEGESGTGKELAAQALHSESGRAGKFVAINCAAVPEQLFEATLFGARKGSYTGANADTPGHLAAAQEGTLFLDEISDLPMAMQPKLLRLLENNEYLRVGDAMPSLADVRVIAAANRPLRNAIRTGGFREDLYHRLSVLVITTPPLRELGDDRMELLDHFRSQAASSADSEPFALDEKATDIWNRYHFPGNVRELRNIVARLQVTHPGMTVTAQIMQEQLLDVAPATFSRTLEDLLAADARNHARAALDATGNLAAAASRLGIHPDHLQELLDQPSAGRD